MAFENERRASRRLESARGLDRLRVIYEELDGDPFWACHHCPLYVDPDPRPGYCALDRDATYGASSCGVTQLRELDRGPG